MKINKILFAIALLFSVVSNAQITKGNWMMGGSGSLSSLTTTNGDFSQKTTRFQTDPNVGYFFIDKLAAGASTALNIETKHKIGYGIGPFVRYYFLEKEKTINIFSEASYKIFLNNDDSKLKYETFNLKAGTVFFLNSSVGIEVALNYLNEKNNYTLRKQGVILGVGFQIHLEKE